MRDVRPHAQIYHRPATIDSGRGAIGNLGVDHMELKVIVLYDERRIRITAYGALTRIAIPRTFSIDPPS